MIFSSTHIQSKFDPMHRTRRSTLRNQSAVALVLCLVLMFAIPSMGQTTRNGGTLNITTPHTYTNFQNYNAGGTPGTVNITSTMTVTGNLDNNKAGALINDSTGGTLAMTGTAGTYTNGAGTTRNGTATSIIKIGNTLSLSTGAFNTIIGEVQFTKAGAQTIPSGITSATYGKLTTTGSGTKSLGGSIIVTNRDSIGAGTTFSVNGDTLTLNGATPVTGTGTFDASSNTVSRVVYNASGAQSVASTSYANLVIQNTNTKTAAGGITIVNGGSLSVASNTTFDLGANALTLQMTPTSAVTNNGTIQTSATGTSVSAAAVYQIGGTFIYNAASGSQTVAAVNYNNLTYANAGTRAITGTVGIAGTFTVAGTRTYTGSTVNYNGSASFGSLSQNIIGGEAYNNLGVSGGAAQADTATHKIVTIGNLTLNGGTGVLTLGANTTLDMNGYTGSWVNTSTMQSSSQIMWQGSNAYVGGGGTTLFYGSSPGNVAVGANYGSLLFTGTGMMTFTGATTLTGNMTMNMNSPVTVNEGVSLQINGNFNLNGPITNNGTITVGN